MMAWNTFGELRARTWIVNVVTSSCVEQWIQDIEVWHDIHEEIKVGSSGGVILKLQICCCRMQNLSFLTFDGWWDQASNNLVWGKQPPCRTSSGLSVRAIRIKELSSNITHDILPHDIHERCIKWTISKSPSTHRQSWATIGNPLSLIDLC